jgi:hypothetical protein
MVNTEPSHRGRRLPQPGASSAHTLNSLLDTEEHYTRGLLIREKSEIYARRREAEAPAVGRLCLAEELNSNNK